MRRVSVGGSLASIAQGAMVAIAEHLLAHGTLDPEATFLDDGDGDVGERRGCAVDIDRAVSGRTDGR